VGRNGKTVICYTYTQGLTLRKCAHGWKKTAQRILQRYTPDEFTIGELHGVMGTQDMFGNGYTVTLDGLIDDPRTKQEIIEVLPELKESTNIFFLIDRKVDAATKKKLEKYADSFEVCDLPAAKKEWGNFALADYFAGKERAKAWVAYQQALLKGEAPEALHGMLFWKIKQILGGNAKRPREEVRGLLGDLAELPIVSRKRNIDLEHALELFILER